MIATSSVPSVFQRKRNFGAPGALEPTIAGVRQMSKDRVEPSNSGSGPVDFIDAAILAGGESRRFGADKCLARLPGDDRTFLDRAIAVCRLVADRVMIIG